jgi:signal transduction histidine kinase
VLAASGTPLVDSRGATSGSLHILRDVTEVKLLQEQTKRGDRLSAMGEMAVELAHEIRNPLGGIELFASLLEKELPAESDPRRWAENIRTGTRSLENIVSNMLHFANPLAPRLAPVDLHSLVEETARFTEPIMRQRDITLVTRLAASSAVLQGDRELLKQMLLNLILNAMQAMPARGALEITTSIDGPGGGALELRVRDTGLGIAPENLPRIFDPFFTTNKNGTGLGLSVVHQIVERHSGSIRVSSEVGAGTTFTLLFPRERA